MGVFFSVVDFALKAVMFKLWPKILHLIAPSAERKPERLRRRLDDEKHRPIMHAYIYMNHTTTSSHMGPGLPVGTATHHGSEFM